MLCCAVLCCAMWVPNVSQIFEILFSPQYSNECFFLIFYFLGVFFILTVRVSILCKYPLHSLSCCCHNHRKKGIPATADF
jgi:hypothetical protein